MVEDTAQGSVKIITYVGGDAYTGSHCAYQAKWQCHKPLFLLASRLFGQVFLAITDSTGAVQEQRQFGAWGQVDRFVDSKGNTTFNHSSLIGRGYTGHETLF